MTTERQGKHEFWMELAQLYATRATCKRRKCAALFVKGNRLVCAGYNGAPSGQPHCLDVGCLLIDGHCKRCVHAEHAAIDYAASAGIAIKGCIVYISGGTPCLTCALSLVAVETTSIYVNASYPDPEALGLLSQAGIPVYEPCIISALKFDGFTGDEVPGWQRVARLSVQPTSNNSSYNTSLDRLSSEQVKALYQGEWEPDAALRMDNKRKTRENGAGTTKASQELTLGDAIEQSPKVRELLGQLDQSSLHPSIKYAALWVDSKRKAREYTEAKRKELTDTALLREAAKEETIKATRENKEYWEKVLADPQGHFDAAK